MAIIIYSPLLLINHYYSLINNAKGCQIGWGIQKIEKLVDIVIWRQFECFLFSFRYGLTEEMLRRKRPGYFSGCCSETKWLGARKKYKWDLFNEMLPAQAAKFDEVPSWLKTRRQDERPEAGDNTKRTLGHRRQCSHGAVCHKISEGSSD